MQFSILAMQTSIRRLAASLTVLPVKCLTPNVWDNKGLKPAEPQIKEFWRMLLIDCLQTTGYSCGSSLRGVGDMQVLRPVVAAVLVLAIGITPGWGATGPAFGTVVAADGAIVSGGNLSAGTTVFGGDRLYTTGTGSVQVRAGAARLLLSGDSAAVLAKDEISPAASLTRGTAIFSTATSKAFVMHVGSMVIRSETDQPTVAQVTVVGPKQLMVRSTRGSVSVAVDDDVRVIPEGMAYRIILDPTEAELAAADAASADQDPQGVGSGRRAGRPRRAGRNRFIWFAIGLTAIITFLAVQEALESPDRPQ
jgi:hypothetical protein